jgi:large subunit ribosomal protein L22
MGAISFDERKTNERPGVRAVHRHARFSAYKAREVLDLIRGKSVIEARTILEFCNREAADVIVKVLDSAVANAGNNNDIPPEELFVSACYADEGPTMKRWRPRARGRATRIRKRTCHITVIVGRYSQTELDAIRDRMATRGRTSSDAASARARRVARSRSATAPEAEESPSEDEVTETDDVATDEAAAAEVTETDAAVETDDAAEASDDDAEASDDAAEASADDAADEPADEADDAAEASADEPADEAAADETEKKDD